MGKIYRPDFLPRYCFNWELFDIIVSGKSAIDSHFAVNELDTKEKVHNFLDNYGFEPTDPILSAELFGNFQETLQFIRRYFLKEGNPEGLDLEIPKVFFSVTEVTELFMVAMGKHGLHSHEEVLWGRIILKVLHIFVHLDKDLRHNYFSVIQQQIFDRFYRYLMRDKDNNLYLGENESYKIQLYDFHTKAKKSRDSIIIKLLHKAEYVAEELFDRVGVRFVTLDKLGVLEVVKFLYQKNIIIPHNIKPSRSFNNLIDLNRFRHVHKKRLRQCMREKMTETEFYNLLQQDLTNEQMEVGQKGGKNAFSSDSYKAVQFTCRQLIRYNNPFMKRFAELRKMAKQYSDNGDQGELVKSVLGLDMSLIAKDVRFFYPFELQIVDVKNHNINSKGEANHEDYKKQQLKMAKARLFKALLDFKAGVRA
jgi:uncharacterized protein (TIGR04562 family)